MEVRSAIFREIHKSNWLKRLTPEGRRTKRPDRSWVVFCVHDDSEALLEGYQQPKVAATHLPDWVISLQTTQHISHSLIPNEHEYEFVITLAEEVVRFQAISWEIMQEWVDTLRCKLREMRILSPKENVYTKLPETRILLPTRDPNSPLPATPSVPAAIVPGIESVVAHNFVSTSHNPILLSCRNTVESESYISSIAMPSTSSERPLIQLITSTTSNIISQNALNMLDENSVEVKDHVPSSVIEEYVSSSTNPRLTNVCHLPVQTLSSDATIRTLASNVFLEGNSTPLAADLQYNNSSNEDNSIIVDIGFSRRDTETILDTIINLNSDDHTDNTSLRRVQISSILPEFLERDEESIKSMKQTKKNDDNKDGTPTNITIINVSNSLPVNIASEEFRISSNENLIANDKFASNVEIIPPVTDILLTASTGVKTLPTVSPMATTNSNTVTTVLLTNRIPNDSPIQICSMFEDVGNSTQKIILSTNTSGVTNISVDSMPSTHCEQLLFSSDYPKINTPETANGNSYSPHTSKAKERPSTSQTKQSGPNALVHHKANYISIPSTSSSAENFQSPLSRKQNHEICAGNENIRPVLDRPMLTRGVTEAVITKRPSRIDLKLKSRLPKNSLEQLGRTRSESLENRRITSSPTTAQNLRSMTRYKNDGRNITFHVPQVPQKALENVTNHQLTLREKQVLHIRREIMHPGGVRLQLRRKDCIGSVAWVESMGIVWVAGWKQKEHPMLYNAFHIGDQLLSIAGTRINTTTDANKIIRNTNALFLEILIRRIPFGRIFAIRRECEGQCLGLIRDGNTATIIDVVPNSLASRFGLPPKAQSLDGLSLTFWTLTEINGRPLNLFSKENEVRDRLNSVGRDISILVQPSDHVINLKKQLKSLRNYKDYILQ